MAVIWHDHLLDQARELSKVPVAGAPRQADLRRAISNCYYAVFHMTATAVADLLVGNTKRTTTEYGLAYRAINHKALKELALELQKPTPTARLARHIPAGGLGASFVAFAAVVPDLQEKRHMADYDPLQKVSLLDTQLAIRAAESAIASFEAAPATSKYAFAALLAFGVR